MVKKLGHLHAFAEMYCVCFCSLIYPDIHFNYFYDNKLKSDLLLWVFALCNALLNIPSFCQVVSNNIKVPKSLYFHMYCILFLWGPIYTKLCQSHYILFHLLQFFWVI